MSFLKQTILVVDDEPEIVMICRDYLAAAGYTVISAENGFDAITSARRHNPDLIVLDLMLPGIDGVDVCRTLRRESDTPIIMLTARVEESDKLIGLELGADDYITKPFSPRELVARVRVVLRRLQGGLQTADLIQVGALSLDRSRYKAIFASGEIVLTPTEFEIFSLLASQPGRIFSRAQLLTAVHGVSFESFERAIDSHIRNLRRKLKTAEPDTSYIITVHGVGYKFPEQTT